MDAGVPLHTDTKNVPLVVDVDGTYLKTDLLAESFRLLLLKRPVEAVSSLSFIEQRAAFKKRIADMVALHMETLPVNLQVDTLIRKAKAAGRKVYLASASDRRLVEALAQHTGLFDGVFASDGELNLKAEAKARTLCEAFGERGFDYAGNEEADFPVWQKAREVIAVASSRGLAAKVLQRFPQARILGEPPKWQHYASALRVHQWPKNLLIFVPTLAAHLVSFSQLLPAFIAFLSFSLCASSVYLLNDCCDLDEDRQHHAKQNRALARGDISLFSAVRLIGILLLASLLLSLLLPATFIASLASYYALTLAYSLWLRRQVLLDVITLACLYGLRLLAGGALGIPLSEWLVVFSIFLFLSLGMIKRCTELIRCVVDERTEPPGRAYGLGDITAIFAMATASGYVAVLVLAFYIQHPDVNRLYAHPQYLWGACLILIYWISRLLLLTSRDQMHDDPVVFAITDRVSLLCGGLLALLAWAST